MDLTEETAIYLQLDFDSVGWDGVHPKEENSLRKITQLATLNITLKN